jgi:transposase
MAIGKRGKEQQEELWVPSVELVKGPGHPFYQRVNELLAESGFDDFVEELCGKFYAGNVGRPGLAPGIYVRMLLVGYFEGISSERGIAWRCADSLALRGFLGLTLSDGSPDHTTVSRTRRLIDLETHVEVFSFVLKLLAERGLADGKTIGVDATTLEANAAMKSLVRRDTGETYNEFLTELAKASGIETPTREDLARIDRKRAKKGSNDDWHNPNDPDAQITKMKDGRTHLAHKAEHAVDMDSGAIMAATIQPGAAGDTTTIHETMMATVQSVATLRRDPELKLEGALAEWVMDKGYHSNEVIVAIESVGKRSYISEPKRGRRRWRGDEDTKLAVYANRRRIKGNRGRRLMRRRGEMLERPFAHCLETGGLRRVFLRGRENIEKRYQLHVAAYNLGLLMRSLVGKGTPRGLHGLACAALRVFALVESSVRSLTEAWSRKTQVKSSMRLPCAA